MRSILLVAAAAAVLAGCAAEPKADLAPAAHPLLGLVGVTLDNATHAVTFAYDRTGCDEGILVLAVDFAHAQSFLPEGFQAADLQALLATPAPVGKAGVWMNAYRCEADG